MKQPQSGAEFLHQSNENLHNQPMVSRAVGYGRSAGKRIANSPESRIGEYLEFLRDPVNDGILTGDAQSIEYQAAAASIPVTPENAQDYADARGVVNLGRYSINMLELEMQALREFHNEQKQELRDWAVALNDESDAYPDWFKYWVFENVRKLTPFINDDSRDGQGGFSKRSEPSFRLFPELDRGSLAIVYDALVEKMDGPEIDHRYEGMREFVETADFAELYAKAQSYRFAISEEMREVTTGSWRTFERSTDPEAIEELYQFTRTYRTGWCTSGRTMAARHLSNGDLYVWCSTNPETGKDEVPRVAIRMDTGPIGEIVGIDANQGIEPELFATILDRISSLEGGDLYESKILDMQHLARIESAISANNEVALSGEDVSFLYELKRDITQLGRKKDPRTVELRQKRGERDYGELAQLLPETLQDQAHAAYDAYQEVANKLGVSETVDEQAFTELFDEKESKWRQNGAIDQLVRDFVQKGSHPILVAVPNILADWAQIKDLCDNLRSILSHEVSTYDELMSHYSAEALSGTLTNDAVRFSIMPSHPTMDRAKIEEQRARLAVMQEEQPDLDFKVPSVLEVITSWVASRRQGSGMYPRDASSQEVADRTRTVHFDLPTHADAVPFSFMVDKREVARVRYDDGEEAAIGGMDAGLGFAGKISIN